MELTRYLSREELHSLNRESLKPQLSDRYFLNQLLGRPVNHQLLNEVRLVLDGKPIPRRYSYNRNGPVKVIRAANQEGEEVKPK